SGVPRYHRGAASRPVPALGRFGLCLVASGDGSVAPGEVTVHRVDFCPFLHPKLILNDF
ncbi:hypothetical protein A2U01_0091494, partial [Trifolium medium]|nr:hypothetical protein [Trifolium medium]